MREHEGFSIALCDVGGLTVTWPKVGLSGAPVRVTLRGENLFQVWEGGDSGESAPVWSEPGLIANLFEPGAQNALYQLAGGEAPGYIAESKTDRMHATLLMRLIGDELSFELTIANLQATGGTPLPMGSCALRVGGIPIGGQTIFQSAHAYGGEYFYKGFAKDLGKTGLKWVHGCIGLALPLVYLYDEEKSRGLQFEFMSDGRPDLSLAEDQKGSVAATVRWGVERLLQPLERHAFGGAIKIKAVEKEPVACMRIWRDEACARYGMRVPDQPDWARHVNFIEFWFNKTNELKPFIRLDDERMFELMRSWKDKGLNTIFAVAPNFTGIHALSPLSYYPDDEYGGLQAEAALLAAAREIGIRVILWVTTVGLDRNAKEVTEFREMWTHRANGSLFYAWSATPENNYVSYAPDGDPLSHAWREYLKDQVRSLIERGYDGIFIDGCIPRGSNHERVEWPGQSRDGVPAQIIELQRYAQGIKPDFLFFIEDAALWAQSGSGFIHSRYTSAAPMLHDGISKGEKRLPPERAREYLLMQHASMLPDLIFEDEVTGYHCDEDFVWIVQSLMAGGVPKLKSSRIDYGQMDVYQPERISTDAPQEQRTSEYRHQGFERMYALMRLVRDEPVIRKQPLTIEGIKIEGDPAVVGFLKVDGCRGILTLINFSGRQVEVSAKFAQPSDVPAMYYDETRRNMEKAFAAEARLSFPAVQSGVNGKISYDTALKATLAPFGYIVYSLTPMGTNAM